MVDFHKERDADVTIAALPVPLERASSFGVIAADAEGRVCGFEEKPAHPRPMPGNPRQAFASMGNYVFNTACLVRALREAQRLGETDFGHHVLPRLLRTHRLFAYDFATNQIPGLNPYEQPVYWRDVGTIDAYFEAHKDVLGGEPPFDMFNPEWPISLQRLSGARCPRPGRGDRQLPAGCRDRDPAGTCAQLHHPPGGRDRGGCGSGGLHHHGLRAGLPGGAPAQRIVDRHNVIAQGACIGYDLDEDRKGYAVSPGGVVVVPRGRTSFYPRGSRGASVRYAE